MRKLILFALALACLVAQDAKQDPKKKPGLPLKPERKLD